MLAAPRTCDGHVTRQLRRTGREAVSETELPRLADDLAVEQVDTHRYRTMLNQRWEMWGPFGGYLASLALSSVSRERAAQQPASIHCDYLAVAKFDSVDILVTPQREGSRAASYSVTMEQGGRQILTAAIWSATPSEGVEHDTAEAPAMPDPEDLPDPSPEDTNPFPFARNFIGRPLDYDPPCPPVWQAWMRFGDASFDDPWLDAARSVILLDLSGWPAAIVHHQGPNTPYLAHSLDLYAAFHRPAPSSSWLLVDGHAPISVAGRVGWNSRVWSRSGELVASGAGQSIWRSL